MPGFPDKIIINNGGNGGMAALIQADLDVLVFLGREIIEHGLLDDTVDLRDRMKKACAVHEDAQMAYHKELRSLIDESAARIDKKILATP